MNTRINPSGRQGGFNMIEVLVTLTVLLIGLLGLAGTMMHGHRSEAESYQRAQALVLLQDMVARINANRSVASCYAFTTDAAAGAPYLGTSATATPACTAGSTAQGALAVQDMNEWSTLLTGAAETANHANVGAMNGARGCVTFDATTSVYQVSVAWQGLGKTAAPPDTWNCGKGNYGDDDRWRRVVSVTLKIAALN
ncbi:MAG TPA: type IV pilus modification protein PilV [Noviherbaspirillum sp.]|uniref:type IV pilus modification protein PilV n=1 Tax=Noviherbaspirillum sp. TaxID=1926288 RepID=UPI002B4A2B58|nr:type IV pilus modification protein PilV [Noviherbaspirillum sp.]HJV85914.1 type IV pilus modification protein PilV [Noviherbaspirillum sp.]